MPVAPNGPIGDWSSTYLTKFLNDWLRRNPLPAQDQLTVKKLKVSDLLTAPTPTSSDDSTNAATTAWVRSFVGSISTGVSSVFGRTGAVTAQSGDYTAAQVTNAADKSSASVQAFSGHISTGPLNNARSTAGTYLEHGTGRVLVTVPTDPTTSAFAAAVLNDTGWRFTVDSNGEITWGTGAGGGDTNLYRGAANQLKTDDQLCVNNGSGIEVISAINNFSYRHYYAVGDANPAFAIYAQGAMTWGPGGASLADIELARLTNSPSGTGSFLELINGDGFGYGTGTGGAVTQATSFSTGVTLHKPTGQITLFTSAISAGLLINFTVTNSVVGADDTVLISGLNMAGVIAWVSNVGAGSFTITWYAPAALASATRRIHFSVIKGAVA